MSDKQRQVYTVTLTCEVARGGEVIGEHQVEIRVKGERGGKLTGPGGELGDLDHLGNQFDQIVGMAKPVIQAALSKCLIRNAEPREGGSAHADATELE